MNDRSLKRLRRRRFQLIGSVVLLSSAVVALYFGTASLRADQALQHASLVDLQFQAQQDPDNPRILYYLGVRAQERGKAKLALDSFAAAALPAPHDEKVWLAWARAAAGINGSSAALDILNTFLQVHPHSAGAHLMAGRILSELGENKRAYEEARAAAQEAPRNERAWRLAGTAALANNDYYLAEDAFRRALTLAPGDWANQQGLGDALFSSTRYQDSLPYYREAVRLASSMGVTHLTLGEALLHTAASPSDFEAARESLRQALARQETLTSEGRFLAYLSLGQTYLAENRYQEAVPWLKQAVPYEPSNVLIRGEVHFDLARAYKGVHDSKDAAREMKLHAQRMAYNVQLRTLSDRIRAHPDNARAYVDLARLYAAHDNVPFAVNLYRQAIAKSPGWKTPQQELADLVRRHTPLRNGKTS